jgi:hypothetical protein
MQHFVAAVSKAVESAVHCSATVELQVLPQLACRMEHVYWI